MNERIEKNLNAFLAHGQGIPSAILDHDSKPLLEKFISYYDVNRIKDLTYGSYCAGHGNNKSFCSYLQTGENIYKSHSLDRPQQFNFNVRLDDNGEPYFIDRKTLKKVVEKNQVDEMFVKTKNAIIDTINGVRNNNQSLIDNASNVLDEAFQNKIMYLYRIDDNQIPYFDNTSIGEVLDRLGVEFDEAKCYSEMSLYKKREKLFEFYKKEIVDSGKYSSVTPFIFACFLIDDKHGYHYF